MRFRSYGLGAALAVTVGTLMLAPPAEAQCAAFSTTADGPTKEAAVARSQEGLKESISIWARENGKRVRVSAHEPTPQPYWRAQVTEPLFLRPDVRTADSHTVCWRGVISAAVCTTGARVCY